VISVSSQSQNELNTEKPYKTLVRVTHDIIKMVFYINQKTVNGVQQS